MKTLIDQRPRLPRRVSFTPVLLSVFVTCVLFFLLAKSVFGQGTFTFPDTTKEIRCIFHQQNPQPVTHKLFIADARGNLKTTLDFGLDSVRVIQRASFANAAGDTNRVWAIVSNVSDSLESMPSPESLIVWTRTGETPPPEPPVSSDSVLVYYAATPDAIRRDWIHNDSGITGNNLDGNPAQWGWAEGHKSLVKFYYRSNFSGHYSVTVSSCAWPKGAGKIWIEADGLKKYITPPNDRYVQNTVAFTFVSGSHTVYIYSDGMDHIISSIVISKIMPPSAPTIRFESIIR